MIKANSKTMEAFNNKIVGDNKNLELNVHSYLTSPKSSPYTKYCRIFSQSMGWGY